MGETMVTGNPIIDPKITMGTACCNLKTGNYIWSNGDITHTYIDMIIYIYILHITNNTVCIDLNWNDTYCWAVAIRCQMCSHAQWPTLDLRFFFTGPSHFDPSSSIPLNLWIHVFVLWTAHIYISLDWFKKIYRKTLYLMVKTIVSVSCRFSLKPIQWISLQWLVWLVTSIRTPNFTRNG